MLSSKERGHPHCPRPCNSKTSPEGLVILNKNSIIHRDYRKTGDSVGKSSERRTGKWLSGASVSMAMNTLIKIPQKGLKGVTTNKNGPNG